MSSLGIFFLFKKHNNIKYKGNNNEYFLYDLTGVLVHYGRSMNQGHYICYCLHKKSNRWFKFDDIKVTISDENNVKSCQPYLLFYERKNKQNWISNYIEKMRINDIL